MNKKQIRPALIAVNEENLINYDKANEYTRIQLNQTINKLMEKNAKLKEENKELKSDIKMVCDVLIKKSPEMEDWVIKHWKYLYEADNDQPNIL